MDHEISFESERWFDQAGFARFCDQKVRDRARYELLNGRIVMNPPSGWPHGDASATVVYVLYGFVEHRGLGRTFGPDQGFELPTGDTVGPDAAFVSNARWTAMPEPEPGRFLRVVPDLVVEILSSSTASRDRGEKKSIYERSGVTEYWLLDLGRPRLTRFVLDGSRYGEPVLYDHGATIESVVLAGLTIPLERLIPRAR